MEFRNLKRQYQRYKKEIDNAIQSVLNQADFIHGEQVSQLELELAKYVGVKHCISCANGTDALQLALMAWGIGTGDAVFVPDFTFFSSGEVVPLVGAVPVFVDVEEGTYNICVASLEKAIRFVMQNTDLIPRAVIAVDLFGQPADFEKIKKIAKKYRLLVLEDAAQGFGGRIDDKKACSFGDIASTSFFPAKPLGCYGDGGAIFTDNDEWADLLRSYCVHGKGKDKYDNIRIGMNSRLDTLQAAVLLVKLKYFDGEIEHCDRMAEEYTGQLREIVKTPIVKSSMASSWAQYTVCFQDNQERQLAIQFLSKNNIPSAIYYKKPMHLQRAFQRYQFNELEYTVTEGICERCLSLPLNANTNIEDIENVVRCVAEAVNI